jgi:hypothetical protein
LERYVHRVAVLFFRLDFVSPKFNFCVYVQEACPVAAATPGVFEALQDGDDFAESNLMHAINGKVFGNLMGLDVVC